MDERLQDHLESVYRFACRLTGRRDAADDLTQQTYLRALSTPRPVENPTAARVWLLRITANLWRDELRRRQSPVARAASLEMEPMAAMTPIDPTELDEDARRVWSALEELPPRQRDVLHLRACEGLSIAEIADVLEITTDAAKASLSVARQKIRDRLADLADQFGSPSLRRSPVGE